MTSIKKTNRIASLDLLKGLVMVVMALDHTRDYFHDQAFVFGAMDPNKTYGVLYFTRWISHFCAPTFCFLAGISAFLVGRRKSKNELSVFLLKRGLWLVFVEIIIVNFGWYFDIAFHAITLQVIWSLGISMILLAAIIRLSLKGILIFSLVVIFGHNLLDNIQISQNLLWSILHKTSSFELTPGRSVRFIYPIIPWVGVMSLGYYFGRFYNKDVAASFRRKWFNIIGFSAIGMFVLVRLLNGYGNPQAWNIYESFGQTFMSFMGPAKYPPSLTFLLMTLGPSLLFLANSEKLSGRTINFFAVFGKVPFFYYIIHIYVIHLGAMGLASLSGFDWTRLIMTSGWYSSLGALNAEGYGIGLGAVYIVWVALIILLYPFCKWFSDYKHSHKEKTWLSYL